MTYNKSIYKLFVMLIILTIALFFLTYLSKPEKKPTKYILFWSPFWTRDHYDMGRGFKPFERCEYENCYATENRALMALEKYDVLIFHASTYSAKRHGYPWVRSPHQKYVFMNIEPPIYICPNLRKYESYFNWTMTYRFDSDIVRRHGYILKEKTNYEMPNADFINNKTKLVAWFVSNCFTRSKREYLVKKIREFIPVDVYGECGSYQCEKKAGSPKLSSPQCYDMVERNYKFYLSFENSYCEDYSTEKLYNLLQKNIVPIVYGGGDYQQSAPANSVINIENFGNVKEFTDYLKYLDANTEAYLKYFEWKKEYVIVQSSKIAACQICKKLHEPPMNSIYDDLHGWWWGKNRSICKIGEELPEIIQSIRSPTLRKFQRI